MTLGTQQSPRDYKPGAVAGVKPARLDIQAKLMTATNGRECESEYDYFLIGDRPVLYPRPPPPPRTVIVPITIIEEDEEAELEEIIPISSGPSPRRERNPREVEFLKQKVHVGGWHIFIDDYDASRHFPYSSAFFSPHEDITMEDMMEREYYTSRGIQPQSGQPEILSATAIKRKARAIREARQRAVAKAKAREARPPKAERMAARYEARQRKLQLQMGKNIFAPIARAVNPLGSVNASADKATALLEALGPKIEQLVDKADRAVDKIDSAFTLETYIGPVRELINNIMESHTCRVVGVTLGAAALCYFLHRLGIFEKAYGLFKSAFRAIMPADADPFELIESDPSIQLQAGLDSGLVAKVIAGTATCVLLKGATSGITISGITKNLVMLPRLEVGFKVFIEVVATAIEQVCGFIYHAVTGKQATFHIFKKEGLDLVKLHDEITEFVMKEHSNTATSTHHARYVEGSILMRRLNDMLRDRIGKQNTDGHLMHDVKRDLEKCLSTLRVASGAAVGYKPEPLVVCLAGQPGIGKTAMINAFAATVLKEAGLVPENISEDELGNLIYTRPQNSQYFEGYLAQTVTVIDDFGAIKDDGPSVHLMDLMTLHSSSSTTLTMPALEDKGNVRFVSRLIILTTNMHNWSEIKLSETLHFPEAVKRRMDLGYVIGLNPDFKDLNGRLKTAEFAAAVAACEDAQSVIEAYPWNTWRASPTNFEGDNKPYEAHELTHSMQDVIRNTVEALKHKEAVFRSQTQSVGRILRAKPTVDLQGGNFNDFLRTEPTELELAIDEFSKSYKGFFDHLDTYSTGDDDCYVVTSEELLVSYPCPSDGPVAEAAWVELVERSGIVFRADVMEDEFLRTCYKLTKERQGLSLWHRAQCAAVIAQTKMISTVKATYEYLLANPLKSALIAGGVALCIAALATLFDSMFGPAQVDTQSNGPVVDKDKAKKNASREESATWKFQSGEMNPSPQERVAMNSYTMSIENDKCRTFLGTMVLIKDRIGMFPLHFVDNIRDLRDRGLLKDEDTVLVQSMLPHKHPDSHVKVGLMLSDEGKVKYENDTCFMIFPSMGAGANVNKRRDITKTFLPYAEFDHLGGKEVQLRAHYKDGWSERPAPRVYSSNYVNRCFYRSDDKMEAGRFSHDQLWSYKAATQAGDCGAPLMITNCNRLQGACVIGMHIGAGPGGMGYSVPIPRERVLAAIERLSADLPQEPTKRLTLDETVELTVQNGGFELEVREVPNTTNPFPLVDVEDLSAKPTLRVSKGVSIPTQSNKAVDKDAEKSMIKLFANRGLEFKPGERMKLHVHNKDGVLTYPMLEASRPFMKPAVDCNMYYFKRGATSMMDRLINATHGMPRAVLTFEQACEGISSRAFRMLPRQTSVGFPHCDFAETKAYYFGNEEKLNFNHPNAIKLKNEVEALVAALRRGERPFFVCKDFLKDEVRAKGKSARCIAGIDIRLFIILRMFFGNFVIAQIESHEETGHCIGVDPVRDAPWMHEFLLRRGKNVFDGDFKLFDSSQQPCMAMELGAQMNRWYSIGKIEECSENDNMVRAILMEDLYNSRHLSTQSGVADNVVTWAKSLPSGHFLTASFNTMLSQSCIIASFIEATDEKLDFWDHCGTLELGDDNATGCDDEVAGIFNQQVVASHVKRFYDMDYTPGKKDAALTDFVPFEEITFLKRTFATLDGKKVCPLDLTSIMKPFVFYDLKSREESKFRDTMRGNVISALEELSMHPLPVWENFIGYLRSKVAEFNLDVGDISKSYWFTRAMNRQPKY
nr:hypothetical protein 1 [Ginkgo biloba dicistrovirus]